MSMIKTVGIVGAGQMGRGIAQVCSTCGYLVKVYDTSDKQLDLAKQNIHQSVDKLHSKNLLSKEQKDKASQIIFTSKLIDLKDADLVIEAVIENEDIKKTVLSQVCEVVSAHCVIGTNTSSLPITKLSTAVTSPTRFIGIHFMNPVPIMNLVEVITGLKTASETAEQVGAFVRSLNKESVQSKDYPGFIINRILMPMINEAFYVLMEGTASAKDIDAGMKLGTNQPMGPLQLADFIGLDTCLSIMRVLYEGFADSKYRPCPLLVQYVEAGLFGKKNGQGVYSYPVK